MTSFKLRLASPRAVYLDETAAGNTLAPRPASLDGKVVGLLPNWRSAAVNILEALGALLAERYRLKAVVMEQRVPESFMQQKGKLVDRIRGQLDDLARRVDVVIAATGD